MDSESNFNPDDIFGGHGVDEMAPELPAPDETVMERLAQYSFEEMSQPEDLIVEMAAAAYEERPVQPTKPTIITYLENEYATSGKVMVISENKAGRDAPENAVRRTAVVYDVALGDDYDVERGRILKERTIELRGVKRSQLHRQADRLLSRFEDEDLDQVAFMLNKAMRQCRGEDIETCHELKMAMTEEFADAMGKKMVENATEVTAHDIYEAGINRKAQSVFRKLGNTKSWHKINVALQHEIGSRTYYIKLLSSGGRRHELAELQILMQQPGKEPMTAGYIADPALGEDKEPNELEQEVQDIFDTLEYGQYIPPEQFDFVMENMYKFELRQSDNQQE